VILPECDRLSISVWVGVSCSSHDTHDQLYYLPCVRVIEIREGGMS